MEQQAIKITKERMKTRENLLETFLSVQPSTSRTGTKKTFRSGVETNRHFKEEGFNLEKEENNLCVQRSLQVPG